MDVSASQSSFWDNDDSRPESPSLLQDRQAFFNGVERIKIKIQQKAPLYISSDQYGASKILQVKIHDLDEVLRVISYSVVNDFGLLLPSEQEDLYSFTKMMCAEPAESPVPIQEQSQLQSYFHFPDRQSQEHLSSTASYSSQDPNVATQFSSQTSFILQSQPQEPTPPTIETTVPLTHERKVDILCVEQLRMEQAPSMTFTQFCLYKGFTLEMVDNGLHFDYPLKYKRGIAKQPVEIVEAVQCW